METRHGLSSGVCSDGHGMFIPQPLHQHIQFHDRPCSMSKQQLVVTLRTIHMRDVDVVMLSSEDNASALKGNGWLRYVDTKQDASR